MRNVAGGLVLTSLVLAMGACADASGSDSDSDSVGVAESAFGAPGFAGALVHNSQFGSSGMAGWTTGHNCPGSASWGVGNATGAPGFLLMIAAPTFTSGCGWLPGLWARSPYFNVQAGKTYQTQVRAATGTAAGFYAIQYFNNANTVLGTEVRNWRPSSAWSFELEVFFQSTAPAGTTKAQIVLMNMTPSAWIGIDSVQVEEAVGSVGGTDPARYSVQVNLPIVIPAYNSVQATGTFSAPAGQVREGLCIWESWQQTSLSDNRYQMGTGIPRTCNQTSDCALPPGADPGQGAQSYCHAPYGETQKYCFFRRDAAHWCAGSSSNSAGQDVSYTETMVTPVVPFTPGAMYTAAGCIGPAGQSSCGEQHLGLSKRGMMYHPF